MASQELGLPENADVPLLGFIGRLDYQKGVDIIRDSYDWLMAEGCQLILLGSGSPDLENSLRCAPRPCTLPLLGLRQQPDVCGSHRFRSHSPGYTVID